MPKPAPYNYSQQPPKPNSSFRNLILLFLICFLSIATSKPTFKANKPGTPSSGNRVFNKGSALLNRNDNINQVARCYACGIHIR